jgi:hypothetical protein
MNWFTRLLLEWWRGRFLGYGIVRYEKQQRRVEKRRRKRKPYLHIVKKSGDWSIDFEHTVEIHDDRTDGHLEWFRDGGEGDEGDAEPEPDPTGL